MGKFVIRDVERCFLERRKIILVWDLDQGKDGKNTRKGIIKVKHVFLIN